jgi:RHS repeat-associated protein
LNGPNNALVRAYTWGNDLSGTPQGAGGVGGLLMVKPAGANAMFAAYDGNGNHTSLVDAVTGNFQARCEYGPFGELLRMTGPQSAANPFRFSTKYADDETDLVYYGYRFYNPSTAIFSDRNVLENLKTREGQVAFGLDLKVAVFQVA